MLHISASSTKLFMVKLIVFCFSPSSVFYSGGKNTARLADGHVVFFVKRLTTISVSPFRCDVLTEANAHISLLADILAGDTHRPFFHCSLTREQAARHFSETRALSLGYFQVKAAAR